MYISVEFLNLEIITVEFFLDQIALWPLTNWIYDSVIEHHEK